MAKTDVARRLTVGAELQQSGGADVRVWAPACRRMDLVIPGPAERVIEMSRDGDGYFHAFDPDARHGPSLIRHPGQTDGQPSQRWQPRGDQPTTRLID